MLANKAADGRTLEYYTQPIRNQDEGGQVGGGEKRPDMATCILGVRRHQKKATVVPNAGTDWFQHIRLSVLFHLWQTRNECWARDLHATESSIRTSVTKDIVHRVLLESARHKNRPPFKPADVLRPGATFEEAAPQNFQDLTQW